MKRTLSVYIISEILPPFLVGLLAFTVILLIARILKLIELVMTRGVPLLQIGKLFALVLPTFLEMTVPMAFLLAIFLGLGRLSADHEILALKASGISPAQIFLPVGAVALLVSLVTLLITTALRPAANLALKKELYNIAKSHTATALKEKTFNESFPKVLIYAEEVIPPGNASQGVLIVDRRDPVRESIIISKVALLFFNEESQTLSFKLFDGAVYERKKNRLGFSQTRFNVYDLRLDPEEAFSLTQEKHRGPKEMSLRRLARAIQLKKEQGLKATVELLELHQRFSFPFAALVFGLLGVASVMIPKRTPTSRSVGLSVALFWLLTYYAMLSLGRALGERELIPAVLAMWLPNIVVGLIAVHLFRKALKDSPPLVQRKIAELSLYLNRRFSSTGRSS